LPFWFRLWRIRKSYGLKTQASDVDEITIELWPTSYILGKVHRLRLDNE